MELPFYYIISLNKFGGVWKSISPTKMRGHFLSFYTGGGSGWYNWRVLIGEGTPVLKVCFA
jgi:hypothetical protein